MAVTLLFGVQDPTFALFPIGLGIAVTIPKYLAWRKTAYYLTQDGVIFQRGMLGTPQRYDLPAERFQRIVERPGLFGKTLGYHAVDIRMREGGRVSLAYVPATERLTERLIALRDRLSDYDEEQELRELAIIDARQRGEDVSGYFPDPPEDKPEAEGSPEAPGPEAFTASDKPEPSRSRRAQADAGEYRPDVSDYDPKLGERDDRVEGRDRGR